MVEPTKRMLALFDKYGAKLTIMADVAEILKYKEYYDNTSSDKFFYKEIVEQLKRAVSAGHDVQLHIHSSYYRAEFKNNRWQNNWAEYNLAGLDFERQNELINEGKKFLEKILKPVNDNYSCFVFRAANWSMLPSKNITKALIANDIKIDTSVFKYGSRNGMINFDYTSAFSETIAYPYDENDVRNRNDSGEIIEFPIYCENRKLTDFISLNRFYRVMQSKIHNFSDAEPFNKSTARGFHDESKRKNSILKKIMKMYPLKADFNQCTGRQLINQLKRVEQKYSHLKIDIPFVTIGHSKLFNKINDISLRSFLKYVQDNPDRYKFATFNDFDLSSYRAIEKDKILTIN
jgi:hypothetical protein